MTTNRYCTPLRYPGGKGRLTPFFEAIFSANSRLGSSYAEAFAGGAGVAMALLLRGAVSDIHINDIDKSIYSFWYSILNCTEEMCRRIWNTDVTPQEWERQKAIQANKDLANYLDLGFSTFFLNRTNRSGIIKRGSMIGGRAQQGKWKIDARYNKQGLVRRIETIAELSDRIHLHGVDAKIFIPMIQDECGGDVLMYLDPPYYRQGGRLYEASCPAGYHEELCKIVSESSFPWVVSYDSCAEVLDMYSGFDVLFYDLYYSAARRYRGDEVMFFSDGLAVPKFR